jgi:hypothetical protein
LTHVDLGYEATVCPLCNSGLGLKISPEAALQLLSSRCPDILIPLTLMPVPASNLISDILMKQAVEQYFSCVLKRFIRGSCEKYRVTFFLIRR